VIVFRCKREGRRRWKVKGHATHQNTRTRMTIRRRQSSSLFLAFFCLSFSSGIGIFSYRHQKTNIEFLLDSSAMVIGPSSASQVRFYLLLNTPSVGTPKPGMSIFKSLYSAYICVEGPPSRHGIPAFQPPRIRKMKDPAKSWA